MKPCIKFLGGKAQLVPMLLRMIPKKVSGRFIDGTVGAGALPFALASSKDHKFSEGFRLSDKNPDLVCLHSSIASDWLAVADAAKGHAAKHSRSYFMEARETFNSGFRSYYSDAPRAGLFMYLARAAYNGVVRYNASGDFNSPPGSYTSVAIDAKRLQELSPFLKDCVIDCRDISDTLSGVVDGDFVFIDPPYLKAKISALPAGAKGEHSFTGYCAGRFGLAEHLRLAYHLLRIDGSRKSARWILCGADTPIYREIFYRQSIRETTTRRSVSAKTSGRGRAKELVISNFSPSEG